MRGTHIRSNARVAAALLAFASLILAYIGVQMDDGPLRAALLLGIIILAIVVGSLIALGIAHKEALEHAKDDWERGNLS